MNGAIKAGERMTKGDLKRIVGAQTDAELARWFSSATGRRITPQAINLWGENSDPIPEARQWQVRALIAEGEVVPVGSESAGSADAR